MLALLTRQAVQEDLITVADLERLNALARRTMQHMDLFLKLLQSLLLFILQFFYVVQLIGGRLSVSLDLVEEVQEVLRVLLQHCLRTLETILLRLLSVFKVLNLLLLHFEHVFHKAHLALLLNQRPAILAVLRSLDRDVEAGCFSRVDL